MQKGRSVAKGKCFGRFHAARALTEDLSAGVAL
jgi:hypothetical protein